MCGAILCPGTLVYVVVSAYGLVPIYFFKVLGEFVAIYVGFDEVFLFLLPI